MLNLIKRLNQIANRMADKVYGDDPLPSGQEKTQRRRITLSLNKANVQAIEGGLPNKTNGGAKRCVWHHRHSLEAVS